MFSIDKNRRLQNSHYAHETFINNFRKCMSLSASFNVFEKFHLALIF